MKQRHLAGWLVLGLAVFGFAGPLAAQSEDLVRVRTEFGEVEAARIAAVVEGGVRDGLPRGLLVDKAIEGVAKGMRAEVVHEALLAYADELRAAMTVVGRDAGSTRLAKAADAIRRGIDQSFLSFVHRSSPDQFAIMVVALEELLDVGVEQQLAEDLIRFAASQGMSGDAVLALPADVKRRVRDGESPSEAANSVRGRIPPTQAS